MEMYGFKVAIGNIHAYHSFIFVAGTKKDLGVSQDELRELIEEHGGEAQDDIFTGLVHQPSYLGRHYSDDSFWGWSY